MRNRREKPCWVGKTVCVNRNPLPQVNYGQGKQAWNPNKRDPVYQQVERARGDAGFAQSFAADILFGKEGGGSYQIYAPEKKSVGVASREHGDVEQYEYDMAGPLTLQTIKAGQNSRRFDRAGDGNYLYNENTLNAAKSWVPQAFGSPAVKGKDGNWYQASILKDAGWRQESGGLTQSKASDGYGFLPGARISDANTLRLLNEGHYAFTAKGYDGSEVYVPWADGFTPGKGGGGKPEAGNSKREVAQGATERDMVTPGTAKPGNVIGGAETLLSGALNNAKKTLLGGTS